jgi:hypothetical protein
LLNCGCGLSDYEAKMTSARARVERFDKENELLADYIDWPGASDDRSLDVFLRLPKGISRTPEPDLYQDLLYIYPATSANSTFQKVYVGISKEMTSDDFWQKLTAAIPGVPRGSPTTLQVMPPDRSAFNLQTVTIDTPTSSAFLYLWQRDPVVLALVYQLDNAKKGDNATQALNMSLESLGVGFDAAARRRGVSKPPARPQAPKTRP